jgi:hypothetical protein
MGRNECLDIVIDELNAAGFDFDIRQGRHHKVVFVLGGKRRIIVASRTPSDHRAATNTRAFVRRVLRAEGVTPRQAGCLAS